MSSMLVGALIVYAAGLKFGLATGMISLPAWMNVPGKAVRAVVAWLRGLHLFYRGARRPRKVKRYRGRHHFRRFEGTYSACTKRGREFGKRRQTGV